MWRLTARAKAGIQVETVSDCPIVIPRVKTFQRLGIKEAWGMEASKMSSKKAK